MSARSIIISMPVAPGVKDAVVRHDNGSSKVLPVEPAAGNGRRLVAGRPVRMPDSTQAGRGIVAFRDFDRVPLVPPVSPVPAIVFDVTLPVVVVIITIIPAIAVIIIIPTIIPTVFAIITIVSAAVPIIIGLRECDSREDENEEQGECPGKRMHGYLLVRVCHDQ